MTILLFIDVDLINSDNGRLNITQTYILVGIIFALQGPVKNFSPEPH